MFGSSGLIISQAYGAYVEFDNGEDKILVNNKHIMDFKLDWGSEDYPNGKITFDESINDTILLQIPKSIPRTTNLDFGSDLYAIQTDESWVQIKETESECFYILEIPVNDSDYVEIESVSVATGRWEPVMIQNEECDVVYDDMIHGVEDVSLQTFISPLKQLKSGIPIDKIRCNEGLKFIFKDDVNPACVKPESIPKLSKRGWISEMDEHSSLAFKKVMDSCANDSSKERMTNILRYSNGTYAFMNLGCDWKKIGKYMGE